MKRFQSAVLSLLFLYAIVVALQFLIGVESLYALLLAPLIVMRSVYWRVGLNRMLVLIALAGVPIVFRRRTRLLLQQYWQRFQAFLGRRWQAFVRFWKHLPVWLRTFLGSLVFIAVAALAMFSGILLWLITFVPFLAKTTLGLLVIRWLARTAAARGINEIAPLLYRLVPEQLRDWIDRHYRRLWWWTMRRIVHNRNRVARRLKRRPKPLPAP